MLQGWIPVYRQIQENWMWKEKPFSKGQAWIDLIMLANYEDKKMPYKGEVITCERGTVNLSISFLADRWGWSRKKTKNFLNLLESDGMVTTKATTHRTVITIENYAIYNDVPTTKDTTEVSTNAQQGYQQGHSKGNTTNNINNINNTNNNNNRRFTPPNVEEVAAYCQERGNSISPEAFMDYYSSKGWMIGKNKMKDWKAAVRNWERRQKPTPAINQDQTDLDDVF